jgi:hypothetical protein
VISASPSVATATPESKSSGTMNTHSIIFIYPPWVMLGIGIVFLYTSFLEVLNV